jgi:alcohol dehydrogenase (cytochrome c)
LKTLAVAIVAVPALWWSSAQAGPVTYDDLVNAGDDTSEWLQYSRTYDGHRYVRLSQINRSNVHRLRPTWIFPTGGENRGLQATPLIHDGVIYMSADESRVFAIDARTGTKIWAYDPQVAEEAERVYCCGSQNRGVALLDDKVFVGTMDARVVALDKDTGEEIWDSVVIDWQGGYSITGAVLVVKDMVLTGVAGGEFGIRGFVKAFDANTGAERWTAYAIPGPGEPGNETWPGDTWKDGGGSTWTTGAYDPELNLVYWQVGNAGPWNCHLRKGDNKWTAGTIAINADTGNIEWGFQYTPWDCWDFDSISTPVLADLEIKGQMRKTLLHHDKNGFFYAIDRTNGQFIYGVPMVPGLNWAHGLDPVTGRPDVNEDFLAQTGGPEVAPIIPSLEGAINWQPLAYNSDTGKIYFLSNTWAMGYKFYEECERPTGAGEWYLCADYQQYVRPDIPVGAFLAVDVATGKEVWRTTNTQPFWSGVVVTSGGLVFMGDNYGFAMAMDAHTGTVLWRFPTGSPISGSPITYDLDGVQYVLFPSGMAGDLTFYYTDPKAGNLIAFALDGGGTPSLPIGDNMQYIPGGLAKVGEPGMFLGGRVIEGYGYEPREEREPITAE